MQAKSLNNKSIEVRTTNVSNIIFSTRATFQAHLIHLHFVTLTISDEQYNLWSSSLRRYPVSRHFVSLRSKHSPKHPILTLPVCTSITLQHGFRTVRKQQSRSTENVCCKIHARYYIWLDNEVNVTLSIQNAVRSFPAFIPVHMFGCQ
jgi:hypothetical protein